MNIIFDLGKTKDIDELEQLYNDLNDHFVKEVNYPGWIKGIYYRPLGCMKNVVLNILIQLIWETRVALV